MGQGLAYDGTAKALRRLRWDTKRRTKRQVGPEATVQAALMPLKGTDAGDSTDTVRPNDNYL